MSADEKVELVPDMPLVRLKQLIDTHYDWALGTTSAPGRPATGSGTDPSKEEPRLGFAMRSRGRKEMLLAIAPRVQRAHDAICDYLADYPRALVVEFLMQQPRHKEIVRRIQAMAETPYGEIRAQPVAPGPETHAPAASQAVIFRSRPV